MSFGWVVSELKIRCKKFLAKLFDVSSEWCKWQAFKLTCIEILWSLSFGQKLLIFFLFLVMGRLSVAENWAEIHVKIGIFWAISEITFRNRTKLMTERIRNSFSWSICSMSCWIQEMRCSRHHLTPFGIFSNFSGLIGLNSFIFLWDFNTSRKLISS